MFGKLLQSEAVFKTRNSGENELGDPGLAGGAYSAPYTYMYLVLRGRRIRGREVQGWDKRGREMRDHSPSPTKNTWLGPCVWLRTSQRESGGGH